MLLPTLSSLLLTKFAMNSSASTFLNSSAMILPCRKFSLSILLNGEVQVSMIRSMLSSLSLILFSAVPVTKLNSLI